MGTNPRMEEESNGNVTNYPGQPLPVSIVPESNVAVAETESLLQIASAGPFHSETSDEEKSEIKVAKNTENLLITAPSLQNQSFSFNR